MVKLSKGLALTAILALASGFTNASLIGSTGPNNFGYEGTDIDFNLRDINQTGTEVLMSTDDGAEYVSFGFNFDFFGNTYDGVFVGSNGTLSFSSGSSFCCVASPISNSTQMDIALAWTDSDLSEGGNAFYQTSGAVGAREFVFGYFDIAHNSDYNGIDVLENTMQVIFHEGSNNIEFQFEDLWQHEATFGSEKVSIGIQNSEDPDPLAIAFYGDTDESTLLLSNQGYLISTDLQTVSVPEPTSLVMILFSALMIVVRRKSLK